MSERVGLCCWTSIFRRSSPITRIVCGLPGATCLSCERTCTASGTLSSLRIVATSRTSSSTADATVAADSMKMTTAPIAKRVSSDQPDQRPWYGLREHQRWCSPSGRESLRGRALREPAVQRLQRLVLALQPDRQVADEVAQRPAVARAATRSRPTRAGRGGRRRSGRTRPRGRRPAGTRSRRTRRRGRRSAPRPRSSGRPRRAARARTGCGARRSPARG